MTMCDACGAELKVGDWPFCKGDPSDHVNDGSFGFPPFEPYIDPHILPHSDPRAHSTGFNKHLGRNLTGTLIESREQRRKIMKEQNLDWAPRAYGTGGSEV